MIEKNQTNIIKPDLENSVKKICIDENTIPVIFALIFFSIIGALFRIWITQVETYNGQPVSNIIYAQYIGCFIMGIILENKINIELFCHTLFIGLSTGLCGSITTFSGVMLNANIEFFNMKGNDRNVLFDIMAGIDIYFIGFGMSFVGFLMGKHLNIIYNKEKNRVSRKQLIYNKKTWLNFKTISKADLLIMICGFSSLIVLIVLLTMINIQKEYIFAMIFAPIGSVIRWQCGKFNRNKFMFPVGTLLVNVTGTLIIGLFYLLPKLNDPSTFVCSIIVGLINGFCGCLTTISTWVVEITGMTKKNGYVYGLISISLAQFFIIIEFALVKNLQSNLSGGCM